MTAQESLNEVIKRLFKRSEFLTGQIEEINKRIDKIQSRVDDIFCLYDVSSYVKFLSETEKCPPRHKQ